jgi:hypothetical protein
MRDNRSPMGSGYRRDGREQVAMENHKVLYKVKQVFPPDNVMATGAAYRLPPGTYEYPFRIKIPFNNSCSAPQGQINPATGMGGFTMSGLQHLTYRHVKKTLPPSLTGFPGEAEIRYYIKVTVQRPGLFKENRRSAAGFKFMPIEPPRPPPNTNEVYARRQYAFQPGLANLKKKGTFSKKTAELSNTPPKGEMDARLPSNLILTCNEPIPLRLIMRKSTDSPEILFMMSLHVQLLGTTEVRAQDIVRKELSTWVLINLEGLNLPIGTPGKSCFLWL